jgi:hypothetical protein
VNMGVVRQRSLRWTDSSSRGVLPSARVSLSVIECNNKFCTYSELVERGQDKEKKERKKERNIIPIKPRRKYVNNLNTSHVLKWQHR